MNSEDLEAQVATHTSQAGSSNCEDPHLWQRSWQNKKKQLAIDVVSLRAASLSLSKAHVPTASRQSVNAPRKYRIFVIASDNPGRLSSNASVVQRSIVCSSVIYCLASLEQGCRDKIIVTVATPLVRTVSPRFFAAGLPERYTEYWTSIFLVGSYEGAKMRLLPALQ